MRLPLPSEFITMENARKSIKRHYSRYYNYAPDFLNFPYDGLLLGDVGKALAAKHFGVTLNTAGVRNGIQGYITHKKKRLTVQIRATGNEKVSVIFGEDDFEAKHLLVFLLKLRESKKESEKKPKKKTQTKPEAIVIYNGPMKIIRDLLPFGPNQTQRQISIARLEEANNDVIRRGLTQLPRVL